MSNTRSGDDQGAAAEAGAIGEHLTSEESEQATCVHQYQSTHRTGQKTVRQ